MSSSSSYSGSSAVYSDSSRASTPEAGAPPPAEAASTDQPTEAVTSEPAPEPASHVEVENNSDDGRDPFAYPIAAELLCQESGLELPKDDIKNLDARMNIRCAIIEGRLDDALQLVKELCPTLLDENREVRFHLMQQNLIEMIRRGEMEKSLEYAQENLSNDNTLTDSQLERLEKTFALLAFEKPAESPFGKLLDQSQRQMVSTEVNGAVLRALNRPAAPRLEALLRMIVWAQKQLVTDREEVVERPSTLPYSSSARYPGGGSGGSTDTNTIARSLFGGTSC
ncbi:hypothetical protein TELCIR_00161 [Teladorsagia circumcincta]|uniref:CTLH domain-containing protein n=1 Tax=Teladorsagia circumcincta TaxID=45464 RepID=A0A2G9V597_TELCI|nr:hypothetical protein TELCIR_00161 [Teladorsagia circumcincta]